MKANPASFRGPIHWAEESLFVFPFRRIPPHYEIGLSSDS